MKRLLPSSPRRRRRLFWGAVTTVAFAAFGAFLLLVPNRVPLEWGPAKHAPPATVITHPSLAPAERAAINATLDRFLRAALDQRSPTTVWQLAGPELKSGSTLREWKAGTSPIPYYPARNRTFNSWIAVDVSPRHVTFTNLVVHPRHGPAGAARVFSGEVVKRASGWLVNRLYTVSTAQPPTKAGKPEAIGPESFAAVPSQTGVVPAGKAMLGKTWLLALFAVLGVAFLVPFAFLAGSLLKSRRQWRRYARPRERTLPPLPKSGA